ncbi:MAG: FtsX-like permease family protein [Treponema sp.]|nr:FtsX-like permease family protein [Treponema sp.]
MIFRLAFKNIVSRKSSFVIILFIAFAISLMVMVNSIFDSTEKGVEKVYTRSFTGDVVIRPASDSPLSLFGDETPVTGKLTKIPLLVPYVDVMNFLSELPMVQKSISQISGRVVVESENADKGFEYVFGVNAVDYADIMSSVKVVEGTPYAAGERGAFISRKIADRYKVGIGDELKFIVEDEMSVRIRAAKVSAIYEYEVQNEILDKIVLVDPFTIRSLLDMSDTVVDVDIDDNNKDLLDDDMDDSMFDDAEDFKAEDSVEDDFPVVAEETVDEDPFGINSTAWNFIVLRAQKGVKPVRLVKYLNSQFKKKSWPVEAVTWRSAAGSTAMYLYWIRFIFNIGVIVILLAGFIVINNTLVINVLNRTQEIGTMRAQGASRKFVSFECMAETLLLTLTAGVLGVIFGSVICCAVSSVHIHFENSFLIQLFGSDTLEFAVSLSVILKALGLSVLLGVLGWIYPVRNALKVSPVKAMQGGS